MEPIHFTVGGRAFELRAIQSDSGVTVECFEAGTSTGLRALVSAETSFDFSQNGHGSAARVLATALEQSVREVVSRS